MLLHMYEYIRKDELELSSKRQTLPYRHPASLKLETFKLRGEFTSEGRQPTNDRRSKMTFVLLKGQITPGTFNADLAMLIRTIWRESPCAK